MMALVPLIAAAASLVLAGISLLRPPRRLRQVTFAAGQAEPHLDLRAAVQWTRGADGE